MILRPDLARAVARGTKTQLRRRTIIDPLTRHPKPCTFAVGETHPIVASNANSNDEPLANIVITSAHLQVLADISFPRDVHAEGFRTTADFARFWMTVYDSAWPPTEERLCPRCHGHAEVDDVACGRCEIGVIDVPVDLPDDQVVQLWRARHGTRQVWVVTFELDERRLLHRQLHKGYTCDPAQAAHGEPEAVPPEILDHYAATARSRYVVEHRDELAHQRARTLARRLREAAVRAARGDVAAPELDDIERWIAVLERSVETYHRGKRGSEAKR